MMHKVDCGTCGMRMTIRQLYQTSTLIFRYLSPSLL
jgi:hypothetical protein